MGRSKRHVRLVTAREMASLEPCGELCLRGSAYSASASWARCAMRQWGFVGVQASAADETPVVVLVAPGLHVPRGHPASGRATADAQIAVVLAVSPGESDAADAVTARLALEGLAARLKTGPSRVRAIEVMAREHAPTCLVPSLSLVERSGFRPVADGPQVLCRMDLRASIVERWTATSRAGLRGLRPAVVRPEAGMRETG